MTDLSIEEQLRIANAGGEFEETGSHGWKDMKIRKGIKIGRVIKDMNGMFRTLTVKFEDGTEEKIKMNNIGVDPEYVHDYEWFDENREKWYRF